MGGELGVGVGYGYGLIVYFWGYVLGYRCAFDLDII